MAENKNADAGKTQEGLLERFGLWLAAGAKNGFPMHGSLL